MSEIAVAWARSQLMILRMEEYFSKEEIKQFLTDQAMAAVASYQNTVYMGEEEGKEGWYVGRVWVPRDKDALQKFLRIESECKHISVDDGICMTCGVLRFYD